MSSVPVAKKFIIRSLLALLVAIVLAVGVFAFIQYQLSLPEEAVTSTAPEVTASATENTDPSALGVSIPAGGIPLSSLPLTDSQKQALKTAKIDPGTFIITEPMIKCAQAKLGNERYAAIIDGAAPSFMEGVTLMGCLR